MEEFFSYFFCIHGLCGIFESVPDECVMGHNWAHPNFRPVMVKLFSFPVMHENTVGYYYESITSLTASCLRKLMGFF